MTHFWLGVLWLAIALINAGVGMNTKNSLYLVVVALDLIVAIMNFALAASR